MAGRVDWEKYESVHRTPFEGMVYRRMRDSGKTLTEISNKSGVSLPHLNHFLNGNISIGVRFFEALCSVLKIQLIEERKKD